MYETVVPGGSLWQSPCGCGCHVVDPFDEPQVGDPVERDDLRRLWGLRAGAGLHAALEMVEIDVPGEVDEAGLLEVAAGAERAVAALRAIQVRALAELAARRSQVDAAAIAEAPPGRRPLEPCTADEVAARLRWTSATANRRVDEAVHLVTALPRTLHLLALGEIDEARARVVVRGTEHLSAPAASLVDAAVQERAPAVTTSRLRRLVSAAALQVDPRGAEERAEQVRDRSAVWSVPAEDGACLLSAVAPAAEVADVLDALDSAARDARERAQSARSVGCGGRYSSAGRGARGPDAGGRVPPSRWGTTPRSRSTLPRRPCSAWTTTRQCSSGTARSRRGWRGGWRRGAPGGGFSSTRARGWPSASTVTCCLPGGWRPAAPARARTMIHPATTPVAVAVTAAAAAAGAVAAAVASAAGLHAAAVPVRGPPHPRPGPHRCRCLLSGGPSLPGTRWRPRLRRSPSPVVPSMR